MSIHVLQTRKSEDSFRYNPDDTSFNSLPIRLDNSVYHQLLSSFDLSGLHRNISELPVNEDGNNSHLTIVFDNTNTQTKKQFLTNQDVTTLASQADVLSEKKEHGELTAATENNNLKIQDLILRYKNQTASHDYQGALLNIETYDNKVRYVYASFEAEYLW